MMKRMSFSETIFLFFLALVIFGPKKLPEIARQVGKALNEFRRASNEFKAQIEQEISNLEVENRKQTILPPSPAPEGTASRSLNAPASETGSADAPATPAASPANAPASAEDEPLFAAEHPAITADPATVTTDAHPATDAVATSTTQESHV
jgi:sec-independent protein translocase protein TatB